MKLFLISQSENSAWDTFDAAVVAAESEADARLMQPTFEDTFDTDWAQLAYGGIGSWATKPENVTVRYLGETDEYEAPCVVLASYNAG